MKAAASIFYWTIYEWLFSWFWHFSIYVRRSSSELATGIKFWSKYSMCWGYFLFNALNCRNTSRCHQPWDVDISFSLMDHHVASSQILFCYSSVECFMRIRLMLMILMYWKHSTFCNIIPKRNTRIVVLLKLDINNLISKSRACHVVALIDLNYIDVSLQIFA